VIDGGGSLRRALVGDQLAALGVKNGWAGIVVYGCIRDSRAIGEMDIGVFALDTHPMKTLKKNVGDADIPVTFGGVTFTPGEWLVCRRGRRDRQRIGIALSKLLYKTYISAKNSLLLSRNASRIVKFNFSTLL
jgi:hypothetical protein